MKTEQEIHPVEVEYYFDQYLMHLVQEVTGRPSIEILAFFYELAERVSNIGATNKMSEGGKGMRKSITDYFPNTSIPFQMLVKGSKRYGQQWDQKTNRYITTKTVFKCTAEVGFPEGRTYMNEDELRAISEALMERALLDAPLDGVKVPQFEKPEIKSPKMYKSLMNSFAGREEPKKRRKKKADDGTTTPTT